MQGLTELIFRKAFETCFPHAFDVAVSPFLSLTHGNLHDALKKVDDVLPEPNEGSIPVIPQILGHECEEFVALANRLYDIGYTQVNWNIGCPMRRVAGKHRGSGILPYPNEVHHVLDSVVPRLKPALSVKMRLGHYDADEYEAIIPILNQYPLHSVCIHPRTGKQQYSGTCDLEHFALAAAMLQHPVVYNGDIRTLADYHRIANRFPFCTAVMIGRGALYDPLLPLRIKNDAPTLPDEEKQARHFVATLFEAICQQLPREETRVRKLKEYWCLVYRTTGISEQQCRAILRQPTQADFLHEVTPLLNL